MSRWLICFFVALVSTCLLYFWLPAPATTLGAGKSEVTPSFSNISLGLSPHHRKMSPYYESRSCIPPEERGRDIPPICNIFRLYRDGSSYILTENPDEGEPTWMLIGLNHSNTFVQLDQFFEDNCNNPSFLSSAEPTGASRINLRVAAPNCVRDIVTNFNSPLLSEIDRIINSNTSSNLTRAKAEEESRANPPEGFVFIQGGSFKTGSPSSEPGRRSNEWASQTSASSFIMMHYEVTQGEWQAMMGNNPASFSACGPSCPVEQVSVYDVMAYANALSARDNLEACYILNSCTNTPGNGDYQCEEARFLGTHCRGYRLPTEAEWEYAARAGTKGMFAHDEMTPDSIGWYTENSDSRTHPVGSKLSNAWGLYDMHGNIAEWCHVWPPDQRDRDALKLKTRGGSWNSPASDLRSAARREEASLCTRASTVGFRLVQTIF